MELLQRVWLSVAQAGHPTTRPKSATRVHHQSHTPIMKSTSVSHPVLRDRALDRGMASKSKKTASPARMESSQTISTMPVWTRVLLARLRMATTAPPIRPALVERGVLWEIVGTPQLSTPRIRNVPTPAKQDLCPMHLRGCVLLVPVENSLTMQPKSAPIRALPASSCMQDQTTARLPQCAVVVKDVRTASVRLRKSRTHSNLTARVEMCAQLETHQRQTPESARPVGTGHMQIMPPTPVWPHALKGKHPTRAPPMLKKRIARSVRMVSLQITLRTPV